MFWAFKLSLDVNILAFFGHFNQKLGEILFTILVTLARNHLPNFVQQDKTLAEFSAQDAGVHLHTNNNKTA